MLLNRKLKKKFTQLSPELYSLWLSYYSKRRVKNAVKNTHIPLVLIYQVGKVGSSILYKTLEKTELKDNVFHIHFMPDRLEDSKKRHVER
jgi:hypothetical protein